MKELKTLILLDLDHTLIYGSFAEKESADLLFRYHKYLTVYERPLARELVEICKKKGDVIVYTTALRRYAKMICISLDIKPIELLSRKNCILINQKHQKEVKQNWFDLYDQIIIIDDSPNLWLNSTDLKINFLVPDEFRGQINDFGLEKIITELKNL
jgi:TFIIF-interacting CTD phosphatase-like protein